MRESDVSIVSCENRESFGGGAQNWLVLLWIHKAEIVFLSPRNESQVMVDRCESNRIIIACLWKNPQLSSITKQCLSLKEDSLIGRGRVPGNESRPR